MTGGGEGGINNFRGTQKLCFLEFESKDKKQVFTTESAKNRSLLTDSGLMVSILGVSGLELYSSGSEPITIFRAQSLLEGQNSRLGGAQAVMWGGHGPGVLPPWHQACYRLFGNFF